MNIEFRILNTEVGTYMEILARIRKIISGFISLIKIPPICTKCLPIYKKLCQKMSNMV